MKFILANNIEIQFPRGFDGALNFNFEMRHAPDLNTS